jgi:hypothetical protein
MLEPVTDIQSVLLRTVVLVEEVAYPEVAEVEVVAV